MIKLFPNIPGRMTPSDFSSLFQRIARRDKKALFSDQCKEIEEKNRMGNTRKGNGNPLQCSCLENPRDGKAWWAAVYGVAQSWTRLKRLSSSSSSTLLSIFIVIISVDPHNSPVKGLLFIHGKETPEVCRVEETCSRPHGLAE